MIDKYFGPRTVNAIGANFQAKSYGRTNRLYFKIDAGLFRIVKTIAIIDKVTLSELCRRIVRKYINERKAIKRAKVLAGTRASKRATSRPLYRGFEVNH